MATENPQLDQTAFAKMVRGEVYDPGDPELVSMRSRAKELCHALNQLAPAEQSVRDSLVRQLFGRTGEHCCVLGPLWVDYGRNVETGNGFFANHNLVILDCARVVFGNNVLVGPNCGFYTACHPIDPQERRRGIEFARPITVGDDVWFGGGVQVMPGVTIGSGSVIGGGSVVVKDIPAGVVAVGNPCKPIKSIADGTTPDCQERRA